LFAAMLALSVFVTVYASQWDMHHIPKGHKMTDDEFDISLVPISEGEALDDTKTGLSQLKEKDLKAEQRADKETSETAALEAKEEIKEKDREDKIQEELDEEGNSKLFRKSSLLQESDEPNMASLETGIQALQYKLKSDITDYKNMEKKAENPTLTIEKPESSKDQAEEKTTTPAPAMNVHQLENELEKQSSVFASDADAIDNDVNAPKASSFLQTGSASLEQVRNQLAQQATELQAMAERTKRAVPVTKASSFAQTNTNGHGLSDHVQAFKNSIESKQAAFLQQVENMGIKVDFSKIQPVHHHAHPSSFLETDDSKLVNQGESMQANFAAIDNARKSMRDDDHLFRQEIKHMSEKHTATRQWMQAFAQHNGKAHPQSLLETTPENVVMGDKIDMNDFDSVVDTLGSEGSKLQGDAHNFVKDVDAVAAGVLPASFAQVNELDTQLNKQQQKADASATASMSAWESMMDKNDESRNKRHEKLMQDLSTTVDASADLSGITTAAEQLRKH